VRVLEEYSYSSMAGRGGGGKGREGREGNEKRKREKIYTHAERVRVGENCGFCMVRKDIDGVLTLLWCRSCWGQTGRWSAPGRHSHPTDQTGTLLIKAGLHFFPFYWGLPRLSLHTTPPLQPLSAPHSSATTHPLHTPATQLPTPEPTNELERLHVRGCLANLHFHDLVIHL